MLPLSAAALLLNGRTRAELLRAGVDFSDRVSGAAFRSGALAPTFADRDVTPLDRYPLNSYLTDDPEVDLDSWRLEVSGLVAREDAYTIGALRELQTIVQNTRHLCVEGWDVIGNYGGVPLGAFLDHVGATPDARFVEVACADDYYESIDIASARHPQSLLCFDMYGAPLSRGHGAPLRLVLPTKLGYKQAKYVTALKLTSVLAPKRGYWEDRGYPWHGGL